jgi:predicted amidohydrolase YtcJ
MRLSHFLIIIFILISSGSIAQEKVDAIFHHGLIYTVDSSFSIVEAFAINDGKILATGSNDSIVKKYSSSQNIDLNGKAVYPGFIDAHCHFYNYGLGLNNADLTGTKSFKEVIDIVVKHAKEFPVEWIIGRGWDQNKWSVNEFPDKHIIDSLFPDKPVFLTRIDGHAALANQAALNQAHITAETNVEGGIIEFKKDAKNKKVYLTGILIDNAVDLVKKVIPQPSLFEMKEALLKAQENCFAVGLTTVDDAGLDKEIVHTISDLQNKHFLRMRIYAMLNPTEENKDFAFRFGVFDRPHLHVCSFKLFADGSLGSRGACLLAPYNDKPNQRGFLLHDTGYYKKLCKEIFDHGFQANTHCIGDSAVRFILHTYGELLKDKNDLRWRIEHAQIVNENDFYLFGKYSIIPSVQPAHATSDMYWAKDRIGTERLKGGYAIQRLLKENGYIADGSDFPVESINPLFGFYAAVRRKDQINYPKEGFQIENKLSRVEALKAMTIWAAYSNFEEKVKGSLEPGKYADFVILENDIMKINERDLYKVKVLQTYIDGILVYDKDNPSIAERARNNK